MFKSRTSCQKCENLSGSVTSQDLGLSLLLEVKGHVGVRQSGPEFSWKPRRRVVEAVSDVNNM